MANATSHPTPARRLSTSALPGIGYLCLGILIFSLQDLIIKLMSGAYPVTQAVAIRSVVAFPILIAMLASTGSLSLLWTRQIGWVLLRAMILLATYLAYYMAFPVMKLADAVVLFFVAPIFIALLAGPVLGERLGLVKWSAVVLGFAGAVVALNPTAEIFEPAALLVLFAALFYAIAQLMARRMAATQQAGVQAFYQNFAYMLAAPALAAAFWSLDLTSSTHPSIDFLVRPWIMPNTRDLMLMAACGPIAAVAMTLLTQAYRRAEANIIGTFEYTALFWSSIWGYLVWREVPSEWTLIGAAMIVTAGIMALLAGSARRTQ